MIKPALCASFVYCIIQTRDKGQESPKVYNFPPIKYASIGKLTSGIINIQ